MIYLFNKKKELQRIVPRKHIISATQTVERNGVYQLTAEMPSFYVDKDRRETNYKKLVEDATFVGHYDVQKRFQIYKIYGTNLTADERGERLIIDAVHIFFDEAKALGNIHDRRFRDSEAKAAADVAFNAIGWHVTDHDVTDRHDINFYRDSVTNAWNKLIETFGVEFDYEVKFDGQKIVSKNVIMKKAIGRWTGERFAYGTNILSLTQEQDESEIYTAAVGRGRGEEAGDGYGPRLEFDGIEWSKDGIRKPKGQNWIEIPSATQEYGFYENGEIKPRIAPEVVFENIENPVELANATYQWLLENCVPKATWTTNVAKIGELNLGDGVAIIYKRAGIVKQARVEKIEHNLLDPSLSKLTLGDFKHFKNRQLKRLNSQIKRANRDARSLITQLKEDFDAWFNAQVIAFRNEFEQAKIDILAEVEADRARMEAEFNQKLNDWTEAFDADVEEAYKKAQENYERISDEITTAVDTTRNELEQGYTDAVEQAKRYAEEKSKAHADSVESKLDAVTGSHAGMLADLKSNVMDIDSYLGSARDIPLDQRFLDMSDEFNQRLRNSTRSASNLIRGSRFDEPAMYNSAFVGTSIVTAENINFVRFNSITGGLPVVIMQGELHLLSGVEYNLHLEYRTDKVTELDGFVFYHNDGRTERLESKGLFIDGLNTTGKWEHASLKLKPTQDMSGRLAIGTRRNFGTSPDGIIDVRLPYLTTTAHEQWLPHPLDKNQNIEEITTRLTQLEDGYSQMIVRSEWNAEMNRLDQTVRNYQTTVDGIEDTIIKLENSELISRGREVLDTVDGFSRKVWLDDMDNPNLIPYAVFDSVEARNQWKVWGTWNETYGGRYNEYAIAGDRNSSTSLGLLSPNIGSYVKEGDTYTLTWIASAHYPQTTSIHFNYMYLMNVGDKGSNYPLPNPTYEHYQTIPNVVYRKYTLTFKIPSGIREDTHILFGTQTMNTGINAFFRLKEPKLEVGSRATPFSSSYSMLEQLSNKIGLTVQDVTNNYVRQSDFEITPSYWQLGNTRIGATTVSSLLRGSANAIDAIVSEFNLTGNLNAKGQITSLAVDAVEGNFSRLFATEIDAVKLTAKNINANAIGAQHLWVDQALVNKLSASSIFSDMITTKTLNAIDVNAGKVRASILEADVITGTHLAVGTSMINKLFATSGRIDQLITKSHFVNNMKALSIEAVEGNFSSLATKYFSANYIDVDWINGKNAWFESMYTQNAMIRKLTAQHAFIRDVQAIEITSNQLNIQTLHSKLGSVEGGLTIYGYDGRVLINNSILENTFSINFIQPRFMGVGVEQSANYFKTTNTSYTTAAAFSYLRGGRYLTIEGYCEMRGDVAGSADTTVGAIRLMEYSSGSRSAFTMIESRKTNNNNNQFFRIRLDLGVPKYEQRNFYVQFYTAHSGNAAYFRINQAYYHG